jgi:hypothetical protein
MNPEKYRTTLRSILPVFLLVVVPVAEAVAQTVDFQRDVLPILSNNCFTCHGHDEDSRMGGLRLDEPGGMFGVRDSGPAVVPYKVEDSQLYNRVISEKKNLRMPPFYAGEKLADEKIETLKKWIKQGAEWEAHWSFQNLKRPELPAVVTKEWIRNPIDQFVLARLEAAGLEPTPEAEKSALARRVSLDLTGLPPQPEILRAYLTDTSSNAYNNLVEKLLGSPHWGEHRARYWLDAARYGDTHGLHVDNYREMWPYRDWVINAFNQNRPFDQFTTEQLAGDLLPDPSLQQRIATGFHRSNVTTNEAGLIAEEYEAIYAKDRADTTGTVWLGLTVGCATCHDHKFDPISQKEFYSITAFFRNTTQYVMDGNISDTAPIVVVPQDSDRATWQALEERAAHFEKNLEKASATAQKGFEAWLESGEYKSLTSPLENSSELLTLSLDGGAVQVTRPDGLNTIELFGDTEIGEGPEEDLQALYFQNNSWAELANLPIESKKPFSIALWFLQPLSTGRVSIMGQIETEAKADTVKVGWKIDSSARRAKFQMRGDPVPPSVVPGKYAQGSRFQSDAQSNLTIGANATVESFPGTWNRLVISYDGSGERAGLKYYLNGKTVPVSGSEYFAKIYGNILNDQPLLLGKVPAPGGDETEDNYFEGGAIADFRIFNQALGEKEVQLLSLWPVLARATKLTLSELDRGHREALKLYFFKHKNDQYRQLLAEKTQIESEKREIRRRGAITHVMQERTESMASAHVLNRGLYNQPGEKVSANTPGVLPEMSASLPRNRLGLAKWLMDDSNPLTARVTINRFWQQIFGTGIVKTSDDFGVQGTLPSHPELLDWLAISFRESGWDIKEFFRLLVNSSTYRQSVATSARKFAKDPENRLLSRGPRFRMDGEMIRDHALASSGLLVRTIGGPSVKPYQPPGVWESVAMKISNTRDYRRDSGEKLYRRSLYTFWKRSAPPANMQIFNAPTRELCTVRRERTNTPLQALVTMNDPQFVEAARFLAQKAILEKSDNFDQRLDYMTERILSRRFMGQERLIARNAYNDFQTYYNSNPDAAQLLIETGESKPEENLPLAQSAAFTMLANQLMNLDEVLNK